MGSVSALIGRQTRARDDNGGGRMSLIVSTAAEEIEVALPGKYPCTPQVRAALRAIPGVIEVQEL